MLYASLATRLPVELRRQVESNLEPADAVAMLRVSKKLNPLTKESPTLLKAMLDEQGVLRHPAGTHEAAGLKVCATWNRHAQRSTRRVPRVSRHLTGR